jgi:hypothetical protein
VAGRFRPYFGRLRLSTIHVAAAYGSFHPEVSLRVLLYFDIALFAFYLHLDIFFHDYPPLSVPHRHRIGDTSENVYVLFSIPSRKCACSLDVLAPLHFSRIICVVFYAPWRFLPNDEIVVLIRRTKKMTPDFFDTNPPSYEWTPRTHQLSRTAPEKPPNIEKYVSMY